jgi:hypothetical protein
VPPTRAAPKGDPGFERATWRRAGHRRPKAPMPNRVCPSAEAEAPSVRRRPESTVRTAKDPSIALDACLPSPAQWSAGEAVQCPVRRLTFRKTHEHSAPRPPTRWPPPEGDDDPAPGNPRAATHVRTRTAHTTGGPKASTDPKARRARLLTQTGVPRHTGARIATPIAPTADEQPRDEDPSSETEAPSPERADCQR